MGFVIDDTGLWPRVLGLESPFPQGKYDKLTKPEQCSCSPRFAGLTILHLVWQRIHMEKAYFNWSSGKHSAMALYYAIKYGKHEVLSLFTIDKNAGTKIAMHEIGIDL